jgi:flagellar L-ring protein precursor FlgH
MKTLSKSRSKILVGLGFLLSLASIVQADSLWRPELRISLVADKKAHAVGDIITIIVQENSTTKKDSSTQTSKKTSLDASLKSFLFAPTASKFMTKKGQLPAMAMSSDNSFDGGGSINNSETIGARFGATVTDVLPNGNLIVQAARQSSFSQESQTIVLRGTLRSYDIAANNTAFSYNLADTSIKFMSSGAVSNSQKKGWFSKVFDVLTPF